MHPLDPIRALAADAFFAPPTLEERLALAMRATGRRLFSHDAANAWLDWLGVHGHGLDAARIELLVREVLLMSPLHPQADALYAALMRPREPLPDGGRLVFMVTSCRKYFAQARRVQADLRARGATACIVVGDPTRRVPHWGDGQDEDADVCTLPVDDSYEALPLKVAAGVNAMVQRFGAVGVVKIDDDCELTDRFTVERFAALAREHDYVGMLAINPHLCRFWHFGKTRRAMGPYTRRFHGGWAGGACYLLAPRAAALVARESALYPAEIGDEFYEDKAIGDFLRRQGVALHAVRHADWGITYDTTERFIAPAPRPESPTAVATPAPRPGTKDVHAAQADVAATIPKTLHLVWIGDETLRPDNLIATWISHHPGWKIQVWGNDDLAAGPWHCAPALDRLIACGEDAWPALATLMQWEILWREGGVTVAADSLCVHALDEALLRHDRFGCASSETAAPGQLSANYLGCRAGDALIGRLLEAASDTVQGIDAQDMPAPMAIASDARLTALRDASPDLPLVVLPSHTFLPLHPNAPPHVGLDGVVGCELWTSTLGTTAGLARLSIDSLRATLRLDDGDDRSARNPRAPTPSTACL